MALNNVLAAGLIMSVIAGLFIICSIVLILVVLIQKGKGGGLSSAFAGGMASGILGSKTGDVLTWITIGLVSFFILVALVLNKWWRPLVSTDSPQQTPPPITSPDTGTGQPAPAEGEQPPAGGELPPSGQPAPPGQ
jgi:preprotein translocase subunit SecG